MPSSTEQSSEQLRREADRLRASLAGRQKGGPPAKYISHIRFPRFKNIQPGTRIDFEFPVTALVGANGSGKTSALIALYGAPLGKSTGEYWFSTMVDPIEEGEGEPNRFIYGYHLPGRATPVEVRKARVGQAEYRRLGYFEPTRPRRSDGMEIVQFDRTDRAAGHSRERWFPVDRPVMYLNFRSELSPFDKLLYGGNPRQTATLKTAQQRLQYYAKYLSRAFETTESGTELRRKQKVFLNRYLSSDELRAVCMILEKPYKSAHVVEHSFYGTRGLSVRFGTSRGGYSEAFAGSGELAVTSLVMQLNAAATDTLVLLDEPEVSLHPGAQERLLVYFLDQALRKRLQIVYTTHSPGLIRLLPPDAIKVFYETPTGQFSVIDASHAYAAFHQLGAPAPNKIHVWVEDRLARGIVLLALKNLAEGDQALFEVDYVSGGARTYFAHHIPTLMHQGAQNFLYLDGDMRFSANVPDPSTIPESENHKLKTIIRDLVRCDPVLGADGGNDPESKKKQYELQRTYLRFLRERVYFLPGVCPEQIVLRAIEPSATPGSASEAKQLLRDLARDGAGVETAQEMDDYARTRLSVVRQTNDDVLEITAMLRALIPSLTTQ